MRDNKLLVVNAWKNRSDLWCAPGGGVEKHASLPDNLKREVMEETGLSIAVGDVCLVNEFHDPDGSFHQVDIYFRCQLLDGSLDPNWRDPEGVVTKRRWVTREELAKLRIKPDSLATVVWDKTMGITYDPLEPIQR